MHVYHYPIAVKSQLKFVFIKKRTRIIMADYCLSEVIMGMIQILTQIACKIQALMSELTLLKMKTFFSKLAKCFSSKEKITHQ